MNFTAYAAQSFWYVLRITSTTLRTTRIIRMEKNVNIWFNIGH